MEENWEAAEAVTAPYSRDGQYKYSYINLNIMIIYEGWNFNSGNYLFTTDTK